MRCSGASKGRYPTGQYLVGKLRSSERFRAWSDRAESSPESQGELIDIGGTM